MGGGGGAEVDASGGGAAAANGDGGGPEERLAAQVRFCEKQLLNDKTRKVLEKSMVGWCRLRDPRLTPDRPR